MKRPTAIYVHQSEFVKRNEGEEFASANPLTYYPANPIIGFIGGNEFDVSMVTKLRDFCNELLDYAHADLIEKNKRENA